MEMVGCNGGGGEEEGRLLPFSVSVRVEKRDWGWERCSSSEANERMNEC